MFSMFPITNLSNKGKKKKGRGRMKAEGRKKMEERETKESREGKGTEALDRFLRKNWWRRE